MCSTQIFNSNSKYEILWTSYHLSQKIKRTGLLCSNFPVKKDREKKGEKIC